MKQTKWWYTIDVSLHKPVACLVTRNVTRWRNLFILQYLAIWNNKYLPNSINNYPSKFNILSNTEYTLKILLKTLKFLPEWQNFVLSGHIGRLEQSSHLAWLLLPRYLLASCIIRNHWDSLVVTIVDVNMDNREFESPMLRQYKFKLLNWVNIFIREPNNYV